MPWWSMIGAPKASRRLAYSVAYSIAALAIPRACAATIGRVCSNVPSVAEPECLPPSIASRALASLWSSFSCAAEQVVARHPDAVELQLRGVRCAAAELVELADHLQARRPAGHDEQRLTAVAEFLVDDGVDDVHVGDAAVSDPHLVAVDDPVVSVAVGAGAQVSHVAAALGSEIASAASLRSPGVPKHSGAHWSICSGEAAWPIADSASAGITIARPMPAQPQNSSSMNIGSDRPVGSPMRSR